MAQNTSNVTYSFEKCTEKYVDLGHSVTTVYLDMVLQSKL
jgi:hypothetical protein